MSIIVWIIFGAIAGLIASMIMGSRGSLLLDTIFGIVGAFAGGWIMTLFGRPGITGFNLYSIVVAVIGGIILVTITRAFRGRPAVQ